MRKEKTRQITERFSNLCSGLNCNEKKKEKEKDEKKKN